MDNNLSNLESLLFAVAKPLSFKELSSALALQEKELLELVDQLKKKYSKDSGIYVAVNNQKVQFITNPANAKLLNEYFQAEISGELTKPSLETLTIIAYRQPITKEELEQIRGVNCSLILRNLLIRGLIEAQEDKNDLATTYAVTMDFIKHMGIDSVEELPNYEKLNSDDNLKTFLETSNEEK